MPVEYIVFFAALDKTDTIGIIRLFGAVFFGNDIASVPDVLRASDAVPQAVRAVSIIRITYVIRRIRRLFSEEVI